MTTDTDLRAYLDTHGQPGAPTAAGWYIFEWRGIVDPLALFVDMLQPERDPCSGITRHAPLHLAAPGEVARLRARVAALEAREAEACPLCYGSSRYVSDVDCDRCANTGAVMVKP